MADNEILGRILWYELLTKDVDAAEDFYKKVVGWTVSPFDGSPHRYDMWSRSGGVPIGGVMVIPAGMNFPPHWTMYVGVPKVEDAISKIERLGGSTMSPPIEVPAMFAIYEPSSPPRQAEAPPEIGDASWHELYTTDAVAAVKFYSDLFGWRETQAMDMGPMGKYHIFARKFDLGGIMKKPPELEQLPPFWGIYFRVPDVNAAVDRVKANGGKVVNGPMDVPGGSIINCMDPQGAGFSLHQQKS